MSDAAFWATPDDFNIAIMVPVYLLAANSDTPNCFEAVEAKSYALYFNLPKETSITFSASVISDPNVIASFVNCPNACPALNPIAV